MPDTKQIKTSGLLKEQKLDKNHIYEVTQRINNGLHFKFGMTDLQDRMIFTAGALVAQSYYMKSGLQLLKGKSYDEFKLWVIHALSRAIDKNTGTNADLNILLEEYSAVRMAITDDQSALDDFIDNVCEIARLVNSDNWSGEDVMAIFFNEFNRYRKKVDAGQVFTPDHITSFMYRLLDVDLTDHVLDATCGSGSFLTKAMYNMLAEAGEVRTPELNETIANNLYGIEMYRKVYALTCANMMLHKGCRMNLVQMDAKSEKASDWVRGNHITKVLMNPPYEGKYGCAEIVLNVMDSVPTGTKCAFILPDKKLEKDKRLQEAIEKHTLTTIIKLPKSVFLKVDVEASIFVFKTGRPQNGHSITGYYIEDDGLKTVKNQGHQDIDSCWQEIEDYWIEAIHSGNDCKYHTMQYIDPAQHLSYQLSTRNTESIDFCEEDFVKTMMDYEMFKKNIDAKEFANRLMTKVLYSSSVSADGEDLILTIRGGLKNDDN